MSSSDQPETIESLRAERDSYRGALQRVKARRVEPRIVELLGVRRASENGETTPIAIDGRDACGRPSDHIRLGCLYLSWADRAGQYSSLHLTGADARRLADLLHAMTDEGS